MVSRQRLYVVRLRKQLKRWRLIALVSIGVTTVLLVLLIVKGKTGSTDTPAAPTVAQSESQIETYTEAVTLTTQAPSEPESVYPEFTYSKDWDADDAYLLAKIAMAEAEGESIQGKSLVILVVLNRVWHEDFPDTISDVIFEENQFEPVSNGRWDTVEPDEDCWEALWLVETSQYDYSDGALYFESADSDSAWHSRNLQFLYQVGNHKFYK